MRIAYITSGAAGMFCGSCMKDNTLVSALIKQGHDALLIPTYTPIRTDEDDVSGQRVFYGGINVYLEQKSWLFRHTPWILDRILNFPRLLRWVSRFAVRTQAQQLGALTVSMLRGHDGKQRKEIAKLLSFLKSEAKPDVIILSNLLISGLVPDVKAALGCPVLGTLQGDDIFLDALPAKDRERCIELIGENTRQIDACIATSGYYADFMARYLKLPREKIHVVPPGINMKGHGGPREFRNKPPYTIGYFARICPEKGFQHFAEALRIFQQMPGTPPFRAKVSGWLGENNRKFFEGEMAKIRTAGCEIEHVPPPDHAGKIAFLRSLDVLSVPTVYREPKGIYLLEAWANGTPVVQPRHGSFPELIEATGGGLLVEPNDPRALAEGWRRLFDDPALRRDCVANGSAVVEARFTAEQMAFATIDILKRYVK
ncbi:MAG: glycosyltransferase family 4 protein [Planctomycetes bacterium]|nr:glycosyltransferase family 4 protein [Planctomycetota bacterium]